MKKIMILGTGCAKCEKLAENARAAIRESGLDIEVEKITDINQIIAMGVMLTPALAIDGAVKVAGRVLTPVEILEILEEPSPPAVDRAAVDTLPGKTSDGVSPGTGKGKRLAVVVGLVIALGLTLWAKNIGGEPDANGQDPQAAKIDAPSEQAKQQKAPSVERPVEAPLAAGDATNPLPRLLDLGRGTCIPCKMMMPVLEELKDSMKGRLEVQYIDISKNPDAAQRYEVRIIPTQLFFDEDGTELMRHTGLIPRDKILSEWKRIGYDFEASNVPERKQQD